METIVAADPAMVHGRGNDSVPAFALEDDEDEVLVR